VCYNNTHTCDIFITCTIVQAQAEIIDHKLQHISTARNDLTEVNSNMNSLLTSASCDEVSFINLVSSLEMDIKKQVGVAKEAMQELDYQTLQFNATDFTSAFAQQLSTWSVTTKQKVKISPFQLI
jgi:flagellar biosynthesis chaperone FliJ